MFLHSGASLHGHEYSARPPLNAPGQRHTIPFLRSALRPLSDAESTSSTTRQQSNSLQSTPAPTPSPRPPYRRASRPVSFVETRTPSTPSPEPWAGRNGSGNGSVGSSIGVLRRPRPLSDCFSTPRRENVVRFVEPDYDHEQQQQQKQQQPPAAVGTPEPEQRFWTTTTVEQQRQSPPVAVSGAAVMRLPSSPVERGSTATPAAAAASEDEGGAYSEASDTNMSITSAGARRRGNKRRAPRSGTKYMVAQPPPRVVRRHRRFIQVRPKLLLQLQQLSAETRPRPAFDVLPSAVLSGSVIAAPRLARRFPRLFNRTRGGGELGANDMILMRSEDYDKAEGDGTEEEDDSSLGRRELIAVISPRILHGDGRTDIVLADGTVWTAEAMPNGSYEFVRDNPDGTQTTARWVKRRIPLPVETTTSTATNLVVDDDEGSGGLSYKYTFSVLDPSSRRHPIMATLTPTTLEVLDHYTTVSPLSSGKYPPSRAFSFDAHGATPLPHGVNGDGGDGRPGRTTVAVPDDTKCLITVSSVWISLQLLLAAAEAEAAAAAAARKTQQQQQQQQQANAAANAALPNGSQHPQCLHGRSFSTSMQDRRISFQSVVGAAAESLKKPSPSLCVAAAAAAAASPTPPSSTPSPIARNATEPIINATSCRSGSAFAAAAAGANPMKRASSTGAAFMQRRRTVALERQQQQQKQAPAEGPEFETGDEGGYASAAGGIYGPASTAAGVPGQKKGLYSMIRRAFRRTPKEVGT